jgi:HSP20 family protein
MTRIVLNPMNAYERIAKSIEEAVNSVENNQKYPMSCTPKADIFEFDKKYNIVLELPGTTKEEVALSINEENLLTIKGEKKAPDTEKKRTFYRYERAYGTFERKFSLPDDADRNSVKAKFDNGLLTIEIAQKEPEKPQEINISIS